VPHSDPYFTSLSNRSTIIRYMVAILIPEPAATELRHVQDSFRPPQWRITMDPHITLLAPDHPKVSADEAAAAFEARGLSKPAFDITAANINGFRRRRHTTLVLEASPIRPLADLATELQQDCAWQETATSTRRPYEPHITLVNQLPPPVADTLGKIQDLKLSVGFKCTEVTLFAKKAAWERWQALSSVSLLA
jgi:2'-5' RNA ligase